MTLLIGGLALGSCAVVPGPKVVSDLSSAVGAKIMFATTNSVLSKSDRSAREAVRQILDGQGFEIVANAPISVEVGFAFRDPSIGFGHEDATRLSENLATPFGQSAPRNSRILDVCADKVARLTIVMFDARTEQPVYRGSAEERRCAELDQDNMINMAAAALRNLRRQ